MASITFLQPYKYFADLLNAEDSNTVVCQFGHPDQSNVNIAIHFTAAYVSRPVHLALDLGTWNRDAMNRDNITN